MYLWKETFAWKKHNKTYKNFSEARSTCVWRGGHACIRNFMRSFSSTLITVPSLYLPETPSLPSYLTLTDVPLRVEMVAGVTVTDVAVQAVLTLSMTTNVTAQPTFICLCFKEGTQSGPASYIYIYMHIYIDRYIDVCVQIYYHLIVWLCSHYLSFQMTADFSHLSDKQREAVLVFLLWILSVFLIDVFKGFCFSFLWKWSEWHITWS